MTTTVAARAERVARARKEQAERGLDALLLGPSADLEYLTGYRPPALERLTMLVLPASGDARLVVPALEAPLAADHLGGLEVDHTAVDLRLAGLVAANGQFSMGRMKVAPRALPDDGRLSVIAFGGQPLGIYARSKDLYYGLHVPHPSVREYQSRRLAVDTAEPMALVLDGWRAAGGPPVRFDVLERVLRVKV